jgi:hypothetical protein
LDIAEEIEAEKRKKMIFLFPTAFLVLIPIGRGAISAIPGLANVGRCWLAKDELRPLPFEKMSRIGNEDCYWVVRVDRKVKR